MATSAVGSSYMMWRQFSGGQKTPGQTGLVGYQAQSVRPDVSYKDNLMGQLFQFAKSAGTLYTDVQANQSAEADRKVQDFMKDKTVAEYSQVMRDGKVPFQDDPLAMSVLRNKAAYTHSLQIEQGVENAIQAGKYKTVQEADDARLAALNGGLPEAAKMFNTDPTDKAFLAGFFRDQERRRNVLSTMQTAVTDKRLRDEAMSQAKVELIAPLPEVMANFGPEGTATYVKNTVRNAIQTGQIREPGKALELVSAVMDQLPDMKGGAKTLEALGKHEFEFGGKDVALRDIFGAGKFDLMINQASQKEIRRDAQRFSDMTGSVTDMVIRGDDNGLISLKNKLIAESKGEMTSEIQMVEQNLDHVRKKNAYQAQQLAEANAIALEQQQRQQAAMGTLGGIISGTVDPFGVATSAHDLGLKNEQERNQVEQALIEGLPEGPQRDQGLLRLASVVTDGFASRALTGAVQRADVDWQLYLNRVSNGETADVPTSVTRVNGLAKIDETALLQSGVKPKFLGALQAAERLGVAPEAVAVGAAAFKKLPEKEQTNLMKQIDNRLGNSPGLPLNTLNRETVKALAGNYLSLNLPAEQAVKLATEDFKRQSVILGDQVAVNKSFFAVNGSKDSVEAGTNLFSQVLDETRTKLSIKDKDNMILTYDPQKQTVMVRNLITGDAQPISQSDLRGRYQKDAAKAQEAKQKATTDAVAAEAKRSAAKRTPPSTVYANPFIPIQVGVDVPNY